MAMETDGGDGEEWSRRVQVRFVTKLKAPFKAPTASIAIPSNLTRMGLSTLVNNLLEAGCYFPCFTRGFLEFLYASSSSCMYVYMYVWTQILIVYTYHDQVMLIGNTSHSISWLMGSWYACRSKTFFLLRAFPRYVFCSVNITFVSIGSSNSFCIVRNLLIICWDNINENALVYERLWEYIWWIMFFDCHSTCHMD